MVEIEYIITVWWCELFTLYWHLLVAYVSMGWNSGGGATLDTQGGILVSRGCKLRFYSPNRTWFSGEGGQDLESGLRGLLWTWTRMLSWDRWSSKKVENWEKYNCKSFPLHVSQQSNINSVWPRGLFACLNVVESVFCCIAPNHLDLWKWYSF